MRLYAMTCEVFASLLVCRKKGFVLLYDVRVHVNTKRVYSVKHTKAPEGWRVIKAVQ